tara:strand:- start:616 stop:810 length:195 start_codon:yes stop_codon:yes gene_type:complete
MRGQVASNIYQAIGMVALCTQEAEIAKFLFSTIPQCSNIFPLLLLEKSFLVAILMKELQKGRGI